MARYAQSGEKSGTAGVLDEIEAWVSLHELRTSISQC
jgi:hypothetical protein